MHQPDVAICAATCCHDWLLLLPAWIDVLIATLLLVPPVVHDALPLAA
jgi:hypothetical protein